MAKNKTSFTKRPENSGRKKGTPNKATSDIREAYRLLIEKNLVNLTKWLETIADKDPERAIKILADLSEFVIPKLSRTELAGDKENPINLEGHTFEELYQLKYGRKPE